MKTYDVVIIGAGVVGSAIARMLSRYEVRVAVFEKQEECGFGVSKSNSGIVHPGTQHSSNTLKGKLCVEGNRLMRLVARQLGVHFKEVGELIVAFTDEDIPRLKALKADASRLKVPGIKIVDKKWLKRHEPNISDGIPAALYAPTAGIISPYRLTYALCENAVQNGVEIYTDHAVKAIHKDGDCFEVAAGNRTFRSNYVVNAAGLYADEVSRMVGVDNFTITPRKGEEFILDKKKEHITNHLIFPLPSTVSKGVLVIKTADGNPMIGPTAQDIADKEDLSTSDKGLETVLASVRRMIPSIDARDIIAYFAGLRPASGEDFIIRHEDKVPGFITVAGIQSPGLTAAPAIAVMVGCMLEKHGLALHRKRVFHAYQRELTHLVNIPFAKAKKLVAQDSGYGDIVCRCEMVSAKEVKDAVRRGAKTLDGIKFRTRAQSGRCHGSFCTTRLMKILAEETKIAVKEVTKRGKGSEIVKEDRADG